MNNLSGELSSDRGRVPSWEGPTAPVGKIGYGVDDHRTIIMLGVSGIVSILLGFITSAYTFASRPEYARLALLIGPSVGFLILSVAVALYWSSKLGKVREMDKVVGGVPWGGGEVVLDIGCGRGLAMVKAAKRLVGGYSVGVDLWQRAHLSGNDPRSIWANAQTEKVQDRVTAVKGLSRQLPFANSSFDVILSGVSIHHQGPKRARKELFTEMARVLKDGGRVGILDAGNGPKYSELLKEVGMSDIEIHRLRFTSFPPFHVVVARKPYKG
jgi:ubiquinone/menaquinone biosynthesis C-methylase UbiE